MARVSGIRKAAIPELPENVKWATQVPLLVIPSRGHDPKVDGTANATARRRLVAGQERAVTLRYSPCCEEHKAQIKIESLITEAQLQGLCNRLTMHMGHGALQPGQAKVEWTKCEEKIPCADCLAAIVE
ncbi:MAG: hypothetical protein ACREFT_01050 [Acetobacteraceae bacterium]